MSIDRPQQDPLPLPKLAFLKPSHRTRPEQGVGLGIFLIISLGFESIIGLPIASYGLWGACLASSMWALWRRHSLLVLKVELSVFVAQFVFQMAASIAFFKFNAMLLTLVSLMLLWCSTLVATLLFWRKERLSSLLLFFPLLWVFYLVGLSMVICMRLT